MASKRIKVEVEKSTPKAHLVKDAAGRTGWIQKRWLKDDFTISATTFEKAVAYIAEKAAVREAAKQFNDAYHTLAKVVKETEKAVAVEAVLDFCDVEKYSHKMLWIPKSLIKNGAVQGWFVIKKIEELLDEYREDFSRYGSVIMDSVGVEDFDFCYRL